MARRIFVAVFLSFSLILSSSLSVLADPANEATPPQAEQPAQVTQPVAEAAPARTVQLDGDYFKGYLTDFGNIVTSPARWDKTDWITAVLVTGASIGLYENDTKIQTWVQENRTKTSDDVGDKVTLVGNGYLTLAVVGGLYGYGYFGDDGKAIETALLSVESIALTGIFVQVIKRTAGRHRPYTGDPYDTWGGPSLASSNDSFPSGHSSSAFAVASVIASEYDNYVVPPLAYTIAAITGYDRMQHNAHWASDVFVGAAIGYFTGKSIVAYHRTDGRNTVSFTPLIDDSGVTGAALTWKF